MAVCANTLNVFVYKWWKLLCYITCLKDVCSYMSKNKQFSTVSYNKFCYFSCLIDIYKSMKKLQSYHGKYFSVGYKIIYKKYRFKKLRQSSDPWLGLSTFFC